MKSLFTAEILRHPIVLWAAGAVVVIAAASGFYYIESSKAPSVGGTQTQATSSEAIIATGTVTPSQNPDLALLSGGRVATVNVTVGQTVTRGALLVSLDTAALSASRAQAAANLEAAQANLEQLEAGPRLVDVSAKQTAVSQAQQTLSNLYSQVPIDLSAAYSNSLGAVHADTDTLFNNADSNPTLAFETSENQAATDAENQRTTINGMLAAWKADTASASTDPTTLEAGLSSSLTRLQSLRSYADTLTEVLGSVILTSSFPQSSVTVANASIGALRASISASLSQIQIDTQQIASEKLAVQSAQDALNQALAGATQESVNAQTAAVNAASANLDAANAALRNATIVAPFNGTVAAVRVKVGDTVGPNTSAVSLIPQSALQVEAYLSESDAPKVAVGDAADVTLDAYGSNRVFAATVVGVDRSPTMQSGVPAYKITLQFLQNDSAISPGMTANVSVTPHN
jgi:multidrug resistance efflux pump